jgi:hypothetical protein
LVYLIDDLGAGSLAPGRGTALIGQSGAAHALSVRMHAAKKKSVHNLNNGADFTVPIYVRSPSGPKSIGLFLPTHGDTRL